MKNYNLNRKIVDLVNLLEEIMEENSKLKDEIRKKDEAINVLKGKLEKLERRLIEITKRIKDYIELVESGKL